MHVTAVSFSIKSLFLKLAALFILRNKDILTKLITFPEVTSKLKVMFPEAGNVADFSSYLTFKVSLWKRGCTISFKLQMP